LDVWGLCQTSSTREECSRPLSVESEWIQVSGTNKILRLS